MEIEKDKIEFSTESCTNFEIGMGWHGCCQYESEYIELSIEECQELVKELSKHIKGAEKKECYKCDRTDVVRKGGVWVCNAHDH